MANHMTPANLLPQSLQELQNGEQVISTCDQHLPGTGSTRANPAFSGQNHHGNSDNAELSALDMPDDMWDQQPVAYGDGQALAATGVYMPSSLQPSTRQQRSDRYQWSQQCSAPCQSQSTLDGIAVQYPAMALCQQEAMLQLAEQQQQAAWATRPQQLRAEDQLPRGTIPQLSAPHQHMQQPDMSMLHSSYQTPQQRMADLQQHLQQAHPQQLRADDQSPRGAIPQLSAPHQHMQQPGMSMLHSSYQTPQQQMADPQQHLQQALEVLESTSASPQQHSCSKSGFNNATPCGRTVPLQQEANTGDPILQLTEPWQQAGLVTRPPVSEAPPPHGTFQQLSTPKQQMWQTGVQMLHASHPPQQQQLADPQQQLQQGLEVLQSSSTSCVSFLQLPTPQQQIQPPGMPVLNSPYPIQQQQIADLQQHQEQALGASQSAKPSLQQDDVYTSGLSDLAPTQYAAVVPSQQKVSQTDYTLPLTEPQRGALTSPFQQMGPAEATVLGTNSEPSVQMQQQQQIRQLQQELKRQKEEHERERKAWKQQEGILCGGTQKQHQDSGNSMESSLWSRMMPGTEQVQEQPASDKINEPNTHSDSGVASSVPHRSTNAQSNGVTRPNFGVASIASKQAAGAPSAMPFNMVPSSEKRPHVSISDSSGSDTAPLVHSIQTHTSQTTVSRHPPMVPPPPGGESVPDKHSGLDFSVDTPLRTPSSRKKLERARRTSTPPKKKTCPQNYNIPVVARETGATLTPNKGNYKVGIPVTIFPQDPEQWSKCKDCCDLRISVNRCDDEPGRKGFGGTKGTLKADGTICGMIVYMYPRKHEEMTPCYVNVTCPEHRRHDRLSSVFIFMRHVPNVPNQISTSGPNRDAENHGDKDNRRNGGKGSNNDQGHNGQDTANGSNTNCGAEGGGQAGDSGVPNDAPESVCTRASHDHNNSCGDNGIESDDWRQYGEISNRSSSSSDGECMGSGFCGDGKPQLEDYSAIVSMFPLSPGSNDGDASAESDQSTYRLAKPRSSMPMDHFSGSRSRVLGPGDNCPPVSSSTSMPFNMGMSAKCAKPCSNATAQEGEASSTFERATSNSATGLMGNQRTRSTNTQHELYRIAMHPGHAKNGVESSSLDETESEMSETGVGMAIATDYIKQHSECVGRILDGIDETCNQVEPGKGLQQPTCLCQKAPDLCQGSSRGKMGRSGQDVTQGEPQHCTHQLVGQHTDNTDDDDTMMINVPTVKSLGTTADRRDHVHQPSVLDNKQRGGLPAITGTPYILTAPNGGCPTDLFQNCLASGSDLPMSSTHLQSPVHAIQPAVQQVDNIARESSGTARRFGRNAWEDDPTNNGAICCIGASNIDTLCDSDTTAEQAVPSSSSVRAQGGAATPNVNCMAHQCVREERCVQATHVTRQLLQPAESCIDNDMDVLPLEADRSAMAMSGIELAIRIDHNNQHPESVSASVNVLDEDCQEALRSTPLQDGGTAFHYATEMRCTECIRSLKDAPPRIERKRKESDRTSVDTQARLAHLESQFKFGYITAREDIIASIADAESGVWKQLGEWQLCDVTFRSTVFSAVLSMMVWYWKELDARVWLDVFTFLCPLGDVNDRDKVFGSTALDYAVFKSRNVLCKWLLAAGASPDIKDGNTQVHGAGTTKVST